MNWEGGHGQRWDKRGWDPPTLPCPCREAVGRAGRALPEGLTSLGGPEGTGSKLINSPGSSAQQMAWSDAAVMGWGSRAVATGSTHCGVGTVAGDRHVHRAGRGSTGRETA